MLWLLGRIVDGATDNEKRTIIESEEMVERLRRVLHVLLEDNAGVSSGAVQKLRSNGAVTKEEWTPDLLSLECLRETLCKNIHLKKMLLSFVLLNMG